MKLDNVIEALENNVVEITFDKLNGESRTIMCTLQPDLLPHMKYDENTTDEYQTVWEVNENGWKKFHWNNLREWKIQ